MLVNNTNCSPITDLLNENPRGRSEKSVLLLFFNLRALSDSNYEGSLGTLLWVKLYNQKIMKTQNHYIWKTISWLKMLCYHVWGNKWPSKGSWLAIEALKRTSQRQKMAGVRAHSALMGEENVQNEGWVFWRYITLQKWVLQAQAAWWH